MLEKCCLRYSPDEKRCNVYYRDFLTDEDRLGWYLTEDGTLCQADGSKLLSIPLDSNIPPVNTDQQKKEDFIYRISNGLIGNNKYRIPDPKTLALSSLKSLH